MGAQTLLKPQCLPIRNAVAKPEVSEAMVTAGKRAVMNYMAPNQGSIQAANLDASSLSQA